MITGPSDHINAVPVIKAAWQRVHGREPNGKEALYTQAVAVHETGYGRLGQFADFANKGMFNWGGVQKPFNPDGTCPVGYARGKDTIPQGGKVVDVCLAMFPSDEQAAEKYIWELTKNPHRNRETVVRAMQGTPEDVANAMKQSGYFTADADKYGAAIRTRAKQIGDALAGAGKSVADMSARNPGSSALLLVLGAMGIGVAAYKYKNSNHG